MRNTRRGKITVTETLFDNYKDMLPMFTNFLPVHIEHRPHEGTWVYSGYSDQFRELSEGECTPEYYVEVMTDDDGKVHVNYKEA